MPQASARPNASRVPPGRREVGVEQTEGFPDPEFAAGRQAGGSGHRPQDQHGDVARHDGGNCSRGGPGGDKDGAKKLCGRGDCEEGSGEGGGLEVFGQGGEMKPAGGGKQPGCRDVDERADGLVGVIDGSIER
jgi:hypothetical protein